MRYLELFVLLFFVALSACQSCTDDGFGGEVLPEDVVEDVPWWQDEPEDVQEEITQQYIDQCYQSQFFYCPPFDAIWQQEIVMDICEDPPVVISIGECEELFECDPSITIVDEIPCSTQEGYPGVATVFCDKGMLSQGDCESDCFEEICDYQDNDCDGETDEGQLNACGECGLVAQEVCDGIDNNCNGYTDEDLLQWCATICDTGLQFCLNGVWASCSADKPMEEVCNGLDDDCDGQIDEELNCKCAPQLIGMLMECVSPPLTCGKGYKTCLCADDDCTETYMSDCQAICVYVPTPGETCEPTLGIPIDEMCNNYDDDCDIAVDEDLHQNCYTGPDGTENVGICQPGAQYCEEGAWGALDPTGDFQMGLCEGEITPQKEDICNGADDDCDGVVDKGEPMDPVDILFVIDWSGSMEEEIDAVVSALVMFSAYYADEGALKWSLVIGPVGHLNDCAGVMCPLGETCYEGGCIGCGTLNDMLNACTIFGVGEPCYDLFCKSSGYFNNSYEYLELIVDFSSFNVFVEALIASQGVSLMNTGLEMLLDAIFLSIHNITTPPADTSGHQWAGIVTSFPQISDFVLSWREDSDVERVIVVFSDEKPQSFLDPPLSLTGVASLVNSTPNLKTYVFSNVSLWDTLTSSSGGASYSLLPDSMSMFANLMEIIDENACQ